MTYIFASEEHIKREKAKVKAAKKAAWWVRKCAAGLCHYCGQKFKFQELTMDHIVPLARGGTTTPGNTVPACRECNKKKGVDTPVDLLFKEEEQKD